MTSTTYPEAKIAAHKMFIAGWVDGPDPLTPYCFDDEKFDPPDAPWAKFVVQSGIFQQETLGAPRNRKFSRTGRAIIMLRKPPLIGGQAVMDALIKAAVELFEGRRLCGTSGWFKNITPNEIGQPKDGRWYEATVTAEFEYVEIK